MNGRIDFLILSDPLRFACHVFEGRGSHFLRDLHLPSSMLHPVKAGGLSQLASDVLLEDVLPSYFAVFLCRSTTTEKGVTTPRLTKTPLSL